jgi:hypothetical protein
VSEPQVKTIPASPLPDDVIDRVAKEVAAQVADHVRFMYPAAAKAVSWDSAGRSIKGLIRNYMAEAARAAERGEIEQCLKAMRKRRLDYRKLREG